MKPVPIANYLDRIGRAASELAVQRPEISPFRPRSLQAVPGGEPRPAPASNRAVGLAGAANAPVQPRPQPPLFERRPLPTVSPPRDGLALPDGGRAEDIALRLAEAHARGREEGLAEARVEAEERHAAERAAAREQAVLERLEFQLNEYGELETAIRSGFARVEENVGTAVARILTPFLEKQTAKYVVDELGKAVARLCAGRPPGLVTVRGPERVLKLLRARTADLPASIEYVEDRGVEAVVEAGATQIVTELRPWAELLASLDV